MMVCHHRAVILHPYLAAIEWLAFSTFELTAAQSSPAVSL
jgi:hypothetical protein